ncbi:MAG: hypothetical protein CVU41_15480 [Chloroflexi bacterium HGW-Chloroflexi-3]|nr:MAG: hypothetical protein CVU41_15480 [Chloroflexi bacterium HGW-Chloroflexi-3]
MLASWVGVKNRRTVFGVENRGYSPILHPYQPNPPISHIKAIYTIDIRLYYPVGSLSSLTANPVGC